MTTSVKPIVAQVLLSRALALFLLSIGLCLQAADGNPPARMAYQGFLTGADGTPLGNPDPANYRVIFRIWNDESSSSAANLIWAEQQTVTVDNGRFSVILGEGVATSEPRPDLTTVFGSVPDVSDRFLEFTVLDVGPTTQPNSTLLPRLRLLPSPYAFLAQHALNAGNLVNMNNSQVVMTVRETRVGINTANPDAELDVAGTIRATSVQADSIAASGSIQAANLQLSGNAAVNGTVTAAQFNGHGTIPVGGIIMWSGSSVPAGWALCNGSQGTPDLRGRFVLGSGQAGGLSNRRIGDRGGTETETLTVSQIPAHSHGASTSIGSGGAHSHGYQSGAGSRQGLKFAGWNGGEIGGHIQNNRTSNEGSHSHSASTTISNTGGGQPHNNMPPFYVLAFIMRIQ